MGKFWDLVKAQVKYNEHKVDIKRYEKAWEKVNKEKGLADSKISN